MVCLRGHNKFFYTDSNWPLHRFFDAYRGQTTATETGLLSNRFVLKKKKKNHFVDEPDRNG